MDPLKYEPVFTKLEVKPGDILLVEVDVGNMPPQRAREHLTRVHDGLIKNFPEFKFMIGSLGHFKVTPITPPVESE